MYLIIFCTLREYTSRIAFTCKKNLSVLVPRLSRRFIAIHKRHEGKYTKKAIEMPEKKKRETKTTTEDVRWGERKGRLRVHLLRYLEGLLHRSAMAKKVGASLGSPTHRWTITRVQIIYRTRGSGRVWIVERKDMPSSVQPPSLDKAIPLATGKSNCIWRASFRRALRIELSSPERERERERERNVNRIPHAYLHLHFGNICRNSNSLWHPSRLSSHRNLARRRLKRIEKVHTR